MPTSDGTQYIFEKLIKSKTRYYIPKTLIPKVGVKSQVELRLGWDVTAVYIWTWLPNGIEGMAIKDQRRTGKEMPVRPEHFLSRLTGAFPG